MIVRHLFISPGHNYRGHHGGEAGHHPIVEVPRIECVAGSGIVGDRYFNHQPDFKGQITFFAWENLVRMWDELGIPDARRAPSATRRNVITEGLDLNALIGREFELQGVRFLGIEECRPCYWMNGAIHPEAEAWMKGRGGLRAKILVSGTLQAASPGFLGEEKCGPASASSLFSVLLTGGQSSRMGQDKALLTIHGVPLWSRQVEVLRAVNAGAVAAIAVAAGQRPDWLPEDIVWIPDTVGAQGPLAGLIASLEWVGHRSGTHLLALAVDLPNIDAPTLRNLWQGCAPGRGAVPTMGEHYEPLAAIYPVEALDTLRAAAAASRWKLQGILAELVASTLLQPIRADHPEPFHNLNTPEDLAVFGNS